MMFITLPFFNGLGSLMSFKPINKPIACLPAWHSAWWLSHNERFSKWMSDQVQKQYQFWPELATRHPRLKSVSLFILHLTPQLHDTSQTFIRSLCHPRVCCVFYLSQRRIVANTVCVTFVQMTEGVLFHQG